ncbi:MAG: PLP-dependent aminotransferase family protein [Clostridiales bacterium]|nr:PLP-dependent aminotransferase family protein [Clostridiales bacterium]
MDRAGLRYADRMKHLNGSAIREIFKYMGRPGMISFAGGNPGNFALPDEQIACITNELLRTNGKQLLQYGQTEGYAPLREALPAYIENSFQTKTDVNDLLVTTGSMQGLDLLLKALINPGDVILTEEPVFLGAIQAMTAAQAKIVPVRSDENGIDTGHLEEMMRLHKPRLLYIIPTFQNPTGRTLSLSRRKEVAQLAARHGVVVAEDDPYRALRYSGQELPAIKSFDQEGFVVLLGSFSKIISPGLRVGFMAGDPELISRCAVCKQCADVHTPTLNQAIIEYYLRHGLLKEHISAIRPVYGEMMNAMLSKLPDISQIASFTKPEGGLFIFAFLQEGLDALSFLRPAIDRGLAFVPGESFYVEGGHKNTLRLNFSGTDLMGIQRGMDILKDCLSGIE